MLYGQRSLVRTVSAQGLSLLIGGAKKNSKRFALESRVKSAQRQNKVLTHGSLFAGIGGFDLGFERAGIETKWQVEIDPYCRRVLERHFPNAVRFSDIKECGAHNLTSVDIISGGFPCQDISRAGLGAGLEGERSGLWSEMHRVVCELRPRLVVVENVAALLDGEIGDVLRDLAAAGYDAEWRMLRASDFGAPHTRERIWIVAYPDQKHGQARMGIKQNGTQQVLAGSTGKCLPIWLQTTSCFVGMDDGLSARAYLNRVGSIGNAVIPQIAEWIGKRLVDFRG
jgi:DNA (cytosine-5)-methyltransferase 1